MSMMTVLIQSALLGVQLLSTLIAGQPSADRLAKPDLFVARAPDRYKAKFETSKGEFVIEVHRDWAPAGADRFFNLVKNGFYDECRFFRVIAGRMAQTGINGNPAIQSAWATAKIADESPKQSNKPGFVSLANAGRDTRSTQFFINLADNASAFDPKGSAPIGQVVAGMEVVKKFYSGYGDGAPRGIGPSQQQIASEGNPYLKKEFPKLDFVKRATIEP